MYYSERRAGQGMKRVAILVPWCPLCLGVPLMREAWCSDHGEGSLGSIKIHCEVSGEGHSPAVGTPKARRVNKDPPMKLHGKGLDITAITYCHYWPCLGKLYENGNEVERNEDSEKQRRETICFKNTRRWKKVLSFMDMCCCVCPHDSLLSCMVDTKPLGAQRVFPVDRTQMQTLSHISPQGIHMLVNCRGVIHSDTIIMCSGNETHI